jgi:hypothetical protein
METSKFGWISQSSRQRLTIWPEEEELFGNGSDELTMMELEPNFQKIFVTQIQSSHLSTISISLNLFVLHAFSWIFLFYLIVRKFKIPNHTKSEYQFLNLLALWINKCSHIHLHITQSIFILLSSLHSIKKSITFCWAFPMQNLPQSNRTLENFTIFWW